MEYEVVYEISKHPFPYGTVISGLMSLGSLLLCLSYISECRERKDYDCLLYTSGSDQAGVKYSTWTCWYKSGLQQLRKYLLGLDRKTKRRAGLDDYLESCGYATGRRAYERNGFTSSTEKLALKHIEMLERIKHMDDLVAMIKQ